MKIAIIGAGAMGSVYAALLSDGGNEIHVIDIWQDHIDAINNNGLRLTGASGERIVTNLTGHTTTKNVGICQLIIIATKASGVTAAAKSVDCLIDSKTLIFTIQNGLGAGNRIQSAIPSKNILLGMAEDLAPLLLPRATHIIMEWL